MSEFTHRLPHQPWSKPSRNEQEYFHRAEFRSRMSMAREREAAREAEERRKWLDAHGGHCPKCGGVLEEIRGPEGKADQCPNCLGVWLDHQAFERLTHPEEKDSYLGGILREVILEWTTGDVSRPGDQAR
jgi:Zn-finger nucleic acid-binding protein